MGAVQLFSILQSILVDQPYVHCLHLNMMHIMNASNGEP